MKNLDLFVILIKINIQCVIIKFQWYKTSSVNEHLMGIGKHNDNNIFGCDKFGLDNKPQQSDKCEIYKLSLNHQTLNVKKLGNVISTLKKMNLCCQGVVAKIMILNISNTMRLLSYHNSVSCPIYQAPYVCRRA